MVEKVKPDPWNLSVNTGVGKQNIIRNFRRDFDKCRLPYKGERFFIGKVYSSDLWGDQFLVEKVKPDPWNLSVNTGVGKQMRLIIV